MNTLSKLKQKYRYSLIILKQLVITDFKLRYKGSALGYLWTLLRPLALFAVLYVVFVNFLRFGGDIPHFPVYLLLGVVLWSYFVEVTVNGLTSIVGKGDLMRKLSFPRYVIVIAGSVSAFINLLINLLVVFGFMVINGVPLTITVLWLPLIILELFVFALGLSFLLSALYVRFRDINYVWEVLLQAGFYVTPIIYPLSEVAKRSEAAANILLLNPVAQIIQDARYSLITHETPTVYGAFSLYWIIPFIVVAVVTVVAAIYFRAMSPKFAEEI
ncbi:MAG TPA: ABC transporter permease [Candidatus Saccharibacteria bacterium]|nr:ABC transporter permease [Candidatus Saccharibacteria bacterium]HRK93984.1 ABC transporter permease [Candidatus Saccharibacteria bacterium]